MAAESKRDDRPKKKKKKKPSNFGLWLGLGIGGVVLLIALIATGVVIAMNRKQAGEANKGNAPVAQNPPAPPPPDNQRGGVVKNPKTLLGNIRARVANVERDNEMRQIALFFEQYCGIASNPNSRTQDGFLDFFKRDSNKIYNNIKTEKIYAVNPRAKAGSDDIVAYETEVYTTGYYCIRANSDLGFVPADQLKAALGLK